MRPHLMLAATAASSVALVFALVGCANRPSAPPAAQAPVNAPNAAAPENAEPGQAGAQALAFAGTTRDGKPFQLADHRDKTLLVNFFSPG